MVISSTHFDAIVIGGGTAGLAASREIARAGKSVALVEEDRLGGDCLVTGCVPSKSYLATAHLAHRMGLSDELGLETSTVNVDFTAVRQRMLHNIERIGEHYNVEELRRSGVTVQKGKATFVSRYEIEVGVERYNAHRFILATGSRPAVPAINGLEENGYYTSKTIWDMETLPFRLLVIGGGAVGVELGQAFARFGSQVTIVEHQQRLLPREDEEIAGTLQALFEHDGVSVMTGSNVQAIRRDGETQYVDIKSDGSQATLDVDAILVATGRRNNVESLALDIAGVRIADERIQIDEHLQTAAGHVWACGDVVGPPYYTHVADDQGRITAANLLGKNEKWISRGIPAVTFCDPEVASVGLTETVARSKYGNALEVLRLPYTEIDRAVTDGQTEGFIKVLLAPGWNAGALGGEIVGAHILGECAGEVIQQFASAMRWRLPTGLLAKTVQAYPTYSLGGRQALAQHWDELAERSDDWSVTAHIQSVMQRHDPVEWIRKRTT